MSKSSREQKAQHTLRVIPCEKKVSVLFQSQEGRRDHSEQRGLGENDFDLRSATSLMLRPWFEAWQNNDRTHE